MASNPTLLKRIILSILTVIAIIPLILSLVSSFKEPQVQTDLQLYQTNLILQASELDFEKLDISLPRQALLGENTYELAEKQYQESEDTLQKNLQQLNLQNNKLLQKLPNIDTQTNIEVTPFTEKIEQQKKSLNQLKINLGIIQAYNNKVSEAIKTWNNLENINDPTQKKLADTLTQLWQNKSSLNSNQENLIKSNLSGWFRYQSLKKLYQTQADNQALIPLENNSQTVAMRAVVKLLIVSLVPFFFGVIGVGLLIFVILQKVFKKEDSLLSIENQKTWQVPWNFEVTWQVLIVGFFIVSQILLPLIFGTLGINVGQLSLRAKAIYVLVSYLTMTAGGLLVLYFSIKSFFPLPPNWFKFKLNFKDILWGIGGYLVALPLVVIVSLINQQIWQGQGGSNPLLSLALESQDAVVLAIFFFTASIAAPFFEEMMFRGFLLPSLSPYFPGWGAIIISGLIFAFAHLNLSEVLPLLVLGMVLGFVYTRSQNLLSSMILHSLWNSGTLLSLFILGGSMG